MTRVCHNAECPAWKPGRKTGIFSNAWLLPALQFEHDVKDVDVLTRTEATAIDRAAKTVATRNLDTGETKAIPYDKLVIATGSSPRRLPIPGLDLAGVHTVDCLEAAEAIKNKVAAGGVNSAVIIGSGFIGLEMAVAFADMH